MDTENVNFAKLSSPCTELTEKGTMSQIISIYAVFL